MALATARGYPYPEPTDPADVPTDLEALATAIDADVATLATAGDDLALLVLMGAL